MKLNVTRKKKLGGGSYIYWVITGTNREAFAKYHGLSIGWAKQDMYGVPITRMDMDELDTQGKRINPGETLELDVKDDAAVFVCTGNGVLSNEIVLDGTITQIEIVTEGGMKCITHPIVKAM